VGPAFIDMRIDPAGAVQNELNVANNNSQHAESDWAALPILTPLTETPLANGSFANAQPTVVNSRVVGVISTAADVDYYQVTLTEAGRLSATVETTGGGTLDSFLTLFGPNQELLLTSDDMTSGNLDAAVSQYLLPGTYFMTVGVVPGSAGTG